MNTSPQPTPPTFTPSQNPSTKVDTPSWLLMGPSGTGKSHSITTMLQAGLEVFVLATEPDAISVVVDQVKKLNLDINKLHWKVVQASKSGMAALIDMAKKVKLFDYEGITKLNVGIGKDKQDQFIEVLTTIQNFKCDRTGLEYGDVTEWGPDRVFVIDSLSGINNMVQKLVVGLRPTLHQGEWNVAMNTIFDLLNELTSSCRCFFVVIAHIDREQDEITGGTKIMVGTLGKKLAPKIPQMFSEVILSKRVGDKFTWSTTNPMADLKARTLEWKDDLPPSFAPIIKAHQARLTFAATGTTAAKIPS